MPKLSKVCWGDSGFTEQTNLLALNAAIERLEQGARSWFAVVADEVRKLASNTAASADQIQSLVDKLNRATKIRLL